MHHDASSINKVEIHKQTDDTSGINELGDINGKCMRMMQSFNGRNNASAIINDQHKIEAETTVRCS